MSLFTDKFFFRALIGDEGVRKGTEGRIYNTADDEVDDPDETSVPYAIIVNNGTVNVKESKDDMGESSVDQDQISIEVAANTREELAKLGSLIRRCVKRAYEEMTEEDVEELGFCVEDYNFSAGAVMFDDMKPCYFQSLNYAVETIDATVDDESEDEEPEEGEESEDEDEGI